MSRKDKTSVEICLPTSPPARRNWEPAVNRQAWIAPGTRRASSRNAGAAISGSARARARSHGGGLSGEEGARRKEMGKADETGGGGAGQGGGGRSIRSFEKMTEYE
eukprot:7766779-Pyramimonas_sp.AAC.1